MASVFVSREGAPLRAEPTRESGWSWMKEYSPKLQQLDGPPELKVHCPYKDHPFRTKAVHFRPFTFRAVHFPHIGQSTFTHSLFRIFILDFYAAECRHDPIGEDCATLT